MKKMNLILIVALFASACKKNYECECVKTFPGDPVEPTSYTIKDTKSNATTTCDRGDDPHNGYGINTECSLK